MLFVADEVITGFGRCGDWFASAGSELEPDIVTCAKGITSGYLPMGAAIAAPWVAEPFWAEGAGLWRHGYTYQRSRGGRGRGPRQPRHHGTRRPVRTSPELEADLRRALAPLAEHRARRRGARRERACSPRSTSPEPSPRTRAPCERGRRRAARPGMLARPLVGGALAVSPAAGDRCAQRSPIAEGFPHRSRRRRLSSEARRTGSDRRQWNELPQAQPPCAAGLSIVNPTAPACRRSRSWPVTGRARSSCRSRAGRRTAPRPGPSR